MKSPLLANKSKLSSGLGEGSNNLSVKFSGGQSIDAGFSSGNNSFGSSFGSAENGVTFIPRIDEDGYLIWSNDGGLANPKPVRVIAQDGVSIVRTIVEYAVWNSGKGVPPGPWTTSIPEVLPGQYLWARFTMYYSNGREDHAYSVSYFGKDSITTIDDAFDENSDNPIQNKVVAKAIKNIADKDAEQDEILEEHNSLLGDINDDIDDIKSAQ